MSIYLADQSELVLEGLCISAGPRKKHFQPNMQLHPCAGREPRKVRPGRRHVVLYKIKLKPSVIHPKRKPEVRKAPPPHGGVMW